MAVTVSSFRGIFPEFADTTTYPDARITFFLTEATLRLLPNVWSELLDTGVAYLVAHRLALSGGSMTSGSNGQTSTSARPPGLITSASEGSVSVSFDVSASAIEGAGDLNLTVYGREFASLAASISVGALQF